MSANPDSVPQTAMGRRIAINALYGFIAEVGSKLASLMLIVMMARKLGPEQYGIFAYGLALSAVLLTLASFGQDQVLTREIAQNKQRVHELFTNSMGLKLIIGVPVVALSVGFLYIQETDTSARLSVTLILIAGLVELLTSTCFAVFQAFERMGFIPVVRVSQRFVTAAVGIGALIAGATVETVSFIYLLGTGLAFVLAIRLLHRVSEVRRELDTSSWWGLFKMAVPVGIAGVLASVLFRVDMVILDLLDTKEAVGNYAAAYRLLDTTLFISISVGSAAYPTLSRLALDTPERARFVYERVLKLLMALTLPLAVTSVVLAEPLIDLLFGTEFSTARVALPLLAPTMALFPIAHVAGLFLVARREVSVVAKTYGIVTVSNVVLNLVLIPRLSLYGAAAVTSTCEVGLAGALLILSVKSLGGLSFPKLLAGTVLSSVVTGILMWTYQTNLLWALTAGAISYVLILVLFERIAFPEDLQGLIRALRTRHVLRESDLESKE